MARMPIGLSISLISISITLPPVTVGSTTPRSLSNKVTASLRGAVTKARGVRHRICDRVEHAVLSVSQKLRRAS